MCQFVKDVIPCWNREVSEDGEMEIEGVMGRRMVSIFLCSEEVEEGGWGVGVFCLLLVLTVLVCYQ